MRIGIDFRMGGTLGAGIGRYILELVKRIIPANPEHQFFVFYHEVNTNLSELEEFSKLENVKLIPTRIRHYSLAEQFLLPRILNKYNLHLMHFPNFNVPIFYRKPFVVTIHDMVHHKISGHKKSRLYKFWAYKYIMQKAAHNARAIITVSEAAKADVANILTVPQQKIHVIYEAALLKPQNEEQVEKVKKMFLLSKPYFVFVGTLERKKNTVQLAKAFNLFLEKYKLDMDLVVAGKIDSHYPEIKDEMLKIKYANHLVFTGYVDDKNLASLYQGAYAFITASIHEGFGLPGVEAMTFGLPILATDMPVFNEVYDNGAVYFNVDDLDDMADKMRLIATDKQFYEQLQEKSLHRGAIFSWDEEAKETMQLYKEVLANETD